MSLTKSEMVTLRTALLEAVEIINKELEPKEEPADGSITITHNPAEKAGVNPGDGTRSDTLKED